MTSPGNLSEDDGPSSGPWHLVQNSESASIGGVGPPSSPQHAAASSHADDFDEHLDRFLYGDGSLVDEAEWYGEVREEEPEAPPFFPSPGAQRGAASQAGGSEYNEPGIPLAAGPPVSDDSFRRLAAESSFKRLRLERPKQAWENHPVFCRSSYKTFEHLGQRFVPSVGVRETLNQPLPAESFGGETAAEIPWTTALGKGLVQKTGALEDEDQISASFCDAFSSKAAGTLTKRASSLQRLVVQLYRQGVASPWRMTEDELYTALTVLRNEGCSAAAPSHILESLHFLHSIARFLYLDLEVRLLEETMVKLGPVGQCILGQILFCIHGVCRWKDSQRLKLVELKGSGESQIIFGDALGSKTSLSKEAKSRFTPYAALAQGLTECAWGRLWIEARRECGLTFGQGSEGFALPTRSLRLDEWGTSPMGAAEAAAYLAEWLEGSVGDGQLLGSHSLKVLALYRSIRNELFNPDLSPADRVLQVADSMDVPGEEPGVMRGPRDDGDAEPAAASEGETDESASQGDNDAPFELPGLPAVRAPFAEVEVSRCRIHIVSGIAHCLRDADFFYCGRRCTPRYSRYAGVGTDDPDVCLQCSRAMDE
eukprot:s7021_g4.t1